MCLGSQLNKQHAPSVDPQELARETERLHRRVALTTMYNSPVLLYTTHEVITVAHILMMYINFVDVHIGLELGRLIQQTRTQKKMSQKDLAAVSTGRCRYSL